MTGEVGVPALKRKEKQDIFLQSQREMFDGWKVFKIVETVSNYVGGDLARRILRKRWVDRWNVATDGLTNE